MLQSFKHFFSFLFFFMLIVTNLRVLIKYFACLFMLVLPNLIIYYLYRFTLKQRMGKDANGDCDVNTTEITVYDYFVKHRNIELRYSGDLPCINVGKPKRPTYLPVEVSWYTLLVGVESNRIRIEY